MKILILNGSPKGKYSITLQTTRYLEKVYPKHRFEVLNVGQKTKSLEKDFTPAREAIERADVLLFSYPVYTFIAPCQLHKFIELLKKEKMELSAKYATQITTSKHFYDVTAHRYVQDNCADLGLKFIRGLSADMDDLLTDKGQKEARDFFDFLCWSVENDRFENPSVLPTTYAKKPVSPVVCDKEKTGDVVILADLGEKDTQISAMIDRFRAKFPRKTRIINLREYPFNGGCLGCFSCAVSGKCVHKDGFDEYLRNEIQTAQAIVYAFAVKDHSMGALFKMYDDRNFCNGHRTVTIGMPVGYLVSGDLSREFNLQTIIEARAQVGTNFLAGVATDEFDPDGEIDRLAQTLSYALEHKYVPPQNFYGVGGMKIFRDLIWLMQGMMRADHKFYKAHGQYDFPQKKRGMMVKMYLVGALLANEKIKAKMGNKMNEGMLMPYEKLFKEMDKK
ncbi:MAG: NAD(P)H-dependent oxidoreductase [Oscillospiraceae bacterium]|nr:NAD(P)H-dependent oxidoreductase [Oscillospiraceae bacterium]